MTDHRLRRRVELHRGNHDVVYPARRRPNRGADSAPVPADSGNGTASTGTAASLQDLLGNRAEEQLAESPKALRAHDNERCRAILRAREDLTCRWTDPYRST